MHILRPALVVSVMVLCLGAFHWPWETDWKVLEVGNGSGTPYNILELDNSICSNLIIIGSDIKKDYIVASIEKGDVPLQGAKLSGDFNDFGKRSLHNDSDNSDFGADITYHATTVYDAAKKMATTKKCPGTHSTVLEPIVPASPGASWKVFALGDRVSHLPPNYTPAQGLADLYAYKNCKPLFIAGSAAGNAYLIASAYSYYSFGDAGLPIPGATLSGDFSGFGERSFHNDSDNVSFKGKILYHAETLNGAIAKLVSYDCTAKYH